eukprot:583096-Amphidinium_carterae.1
MMVISANKCLGAHHVMASLVTTWFLNSLERLLMTHCLLGQSPSRASNIDHVFMNAVCHFDPCVAGEALCLSPLSRRTQLHVAAVHVFDLCSRGLARDVCKRARAFVNSIIVH